MKKKSKGAVVLLLSAALLGLTVFKAAGAAHAAADPPAGVQNKAPASYSIYAPYGLRFDGEENAPTFDNEPVRCFYGGVDLGDGAASVYCDYLNESGTVDVHTVREPLANRDGSTDPFGRLTGIERYSREEFERRDLSDFYGPSHAVTYASGNDDPAAKPFAERFEPYKELGVEYIEAQSASGCGNVYYHGQLVNTFTDLTPDGGAFSFQSADGGGIKVQTVYDSGGALTGLQTAPVH